MADNFAFTAGSGSTSKALNIGSALSPWVVEGAVARVSDSFSRVADANIYAAGDHVASTVTAGSVTAANSAFVLANAVRAGTSSDLGGYIEQIVLVSDDVDTTASDFRVHFFDIDPYTVAPTSGDNAAISLDTTIADNYLGYIDVSLDLTLFESETTGVGIPDVPIPVLANSGTTIWGVLEARNTYTPASGETFTLYAQISQK